MDPVNCWECGERRRDDERPCPVCGAPADETTLEEDISAARRVLRNFEKRGGVTLEALKRELKMDN